MSAKELRVIHHPRQVPLSAGEGPWSWSILAGSQKEADHPVQVGFWKQQDFTLDPAESEEPEPAAYDEVKYLVRGRLELEDAQSGKRHTIEAGDVLWIPKGAKIRGISSKDVEAFYAEQRELTAGEELSNIAPTGKALALDQWRAELTADFVKANPMSKQLAERASRVMPGGNTRSVLHSLPFPLGFDRAQGADLHSLDDRWYLDFVSEYTAAMYGHSHPEIQKAIHEAAGDGFNLGGPSPYETQLAEVICSRFKSIEQVRFCNSGTEANTMALAGALAITKRKKIVVFEHGYHGGTLSFHSRDNPINIPHQFEFGVYNDIAKTEPLLTDSVAAILVEPMQGAGGVIPATPEFLKFLRDRASSIGAILIFDEVMTSRLAIGGLQGHWNIYPDMTTLGKYIGGGFSFGAFGGRAHLMSVFDPTKPGSFAHSGTFNQNAFSMRAGLAGSALLTEERVATANSLGDQIREGIRSVAKRHAFDGLALTGFGSMVGMHWSGPDADTLREALFRFLVSKGLYIGQRGFIALNICHDQSHITRLVEAVDEFFSRVKECWQAEMVVKKAQPDPEVNGTSYPKGAPM